MHIVTDSGADLCLPAEQLAGLGIHVVPLVVTLNNVAYRENVDIQASDFYALLGGTDALPTTSQPSVGDFASVYRELAADDPEILSIHISSGLSGTIGAARSGAALVPEAHVTLYDTKTLSVPSGWLAWAAARAAQAGWAMDRILELLDGLSEATETIYTLDQLRYLIHGGRISHMKGLIASVLHIKPLIGVEKVRGTYVQLGQARTLKRALGGLVDIIAHQHEPGSRLRAQVVHGANPEAAATLRELISERFECTWLPTGTLSLVLGAHTGPSMVGVAYASASAWASVP
jgi:DegV family protein with EDD domain